LRWILHFQRKGARRKTRKKEENYFLTSVEESLEL